ncbi:hypothetical protein Ae263Ps1_6382 [Pseudonocardia sp. Ae263_Ps1]|nr:hypothetical protein Ae263Ps1_6382 [Pseudonocardia sp. Ae263_Ps1]
MGRSAALGSMVAGVAGLGVADVVVVLWSGSVRSS